MMNGIVAELDTFDEIRFRFPSRQSIQPKRNQYRYLTTFATPKDTHTRSTKNAINDTTASIGDRKLVL